MKEADVSGVSTIVYGETEKISEYGIAAVQNALLLSDVSDIRMEIQVLAPAGADKNHLYAVRNAAAKCSRARQLECAPIEITRTAAVAHISVLVSGYGIRKKSEKPEVMQAGQDIVLTKYIGMEGTLRILDDRRSELGKRFANVFLSQIQDRREEIFAAKEIALAKRAGVSAMRQVGEGGIFAALYRLAKEAGTGLSVDLKAISIRQETIELCEYYRLNPYQLASVGNLLILCENGEALVETLQNKNIKASVIGQLTGDNDKIIRNGEDLRYIDRPAPDEVMKLYL